MVGGGKDSYYRLPWLQAADRAAAFYFIQVVCMTAMVAIMIMHMP